MKILKLIFKTLLFGSIVFCLFPVLVFAEGATYYSMPVNENVIAFDRYYSGSTSHNYAKVGNDNVRGIYVGTTSSGTAYLISENAFQGYLGPLSNGNLSTSTRTATYNNKTYYYFSLTVSNGTMTETTFPFLPKLAGENALVSALYYTFGEGSVDPEPVYNWGSVRDPEYTTRIAGSGSAAKQNIDILKWNSGFDTNGNSISECEVEIQAVPGSWSDSTLQGLLNKTLNDLDFTGVQPVSLDTVAASDGLYNVSWQSVVNSLNWVFDEYLYARQAQENLWQKYGWYYRIRLLSPDGYEGQWQTLYTPLTSSAQDSETVINHNSFDMSVNQVYQNITQLNNNTSVTIIYNDTDYTVQNPDNGTEPSGGTTLWDILKELLNGIFQILAKLGDLIVGLVDGLFDLFQSLFTPPEVDQTVNNDINLNINNYITESQPGLQDQQLHLHQIFTDLETISSSYSNGGDCILTWENVSMDLSVFNAGTVTFIPGGTYDFKAAFMQLLAGFGMTYATYQMLVSGVIYILLFVLISHKVKGFLKKT